MLGGLLLLAFVPLYVAVATYTTIALQNIRSAHARSLGRAVAGHVAEARATRSPADLAALLSSEVGAEGVEAIGVYDQEGHPVARSGDISAVDHLPGGIDPRREATHEIQGAHGPALAVVVPGESGAVVAVLRIDDQAARAAPLLRLLSLYTGLVALVLLVLAYFALTRLIVRPLDGLTRAAERVAGGARRLTLPETPVPELTELGQSLKTMTEKLIHEEDALLRKIDEVEAATRDLKQAQDRLVRSERLASVGRLAAGLAHEIGNPISALMGMQDLLLAGGLEGPEIQDFLLRMRRETERIHRILRDLLQFARPGADAGLGDEAEAGDVAAAITDTAALVAPQKTLKNVDLHVDLEQDLPPVTMGRAQLVQVALNLVLNAADAVEAGGHVKVIARGEKESVTLIVEDDGPGVSDQIRERLFEPFVTTKEVGKGTGLGLAVCRGLIEAVGGSISLDASYRGGARFVVTLPREQVSEASDRDRR